jgi:hypothetical protein
MRKGSYLLGALAVFTPAVFAFYGCGSSDSGGLGDDGGPGSGDGGPGSGDSPSFMDASFTAPDCPGCTFPPLNAPACAAGTPALKVVYPNDGVLVPPNMNVISVHWTPFGTPFQRFEVDFENSVTDMRVITKCAKQTVDTEQPPQPSGGCELQLDPAMWKFASDQNRGGDSLVITVRGTTDGTCANTSANQVHMAFAQDDMLGAIYYWKSTVTSNGVGGQIWVKSFGDNNPEQLVTGAAFMATCNGCHALSRDGLRMVINSDDDDSDDEYSDVGSSLVDMATRMPIGGGGGRGNMEPGFATFFPDHTEFLRSNGPGNVNPPTNACYLYDGVAGAMQATVTVPGPSYVTMPDWSPDGKSVVFVVPSATAAWTNSHGAPLNDDDHIFGGGLYLMPYMGNMAFGGPTPLFPSQGENNYYPSFSPDGQFIIFDRATRDMSVGAIDGCSGTAPQRVCPNDSFSNPNARVMLMAAHSGSFPVDLEAANGSPASAPVAVSNSWPKWSPFLQNYKGDKILWIAFSSTRDYGLRVRNHQPGMYQCYPADSYEDPGAAHHQPFDPTCQQPQLWMAAIDLSKAPALGGDPSRVAFWLPFQDINTHNHTPQWTQAVAGSPDAGACIPTGGNCMQNPTACCNGVCQADGTCSGPIR